MSDLKTSIAEVKTDLKHLMRALEAVEDSREDVAALKARANSAEARLKQLEASVADLRENRVHHEDLDDIREEMKRQGNKLWDFVKIVLTAGGTSGAAIWLAG
jgi:chromosome segregation ATPase